MYMGLYTVCARLWQRGSQGRPQGVRRHTLRLGTYSGIVIAIPEALAHGVRWKRPCCPDGRGSLLWQVGCAERICDRSPSFFAEVDWLLQIMDKRDGGTPLPISLLRHPRLVHSHTFMMHRKSFPKMTDVVFFYQGIVRELSSVINPLHRELIVLTVSLLYLLGRLEQAAAHDDIINCIESLDLIDNITTTLRGLCEVAYSVREKARGSSS